ncbi:MAG: hypothetical protein ACOYN8_00520 [Pseudanabaena sp.]
MDKFQMFDFVTLNQDIQLHAGGIAAQGTDGAIVEIFKGCRKQKNNSQEI